MIPPVVGAVTAWSQAFSIRTKIMGLAAGLVILMGVGATVVAQSTFLQHAQAELDRRGASIADDVSARGADLVLTHNTLAVRELLFDTVANNDDVRYVIILDLSGRPVAHTFDQGFPTDLLTLPVPVSSQRLRMERIQTEEGIIHDVAVPLLDGAAGVVRVGMSESRLRRAAMELTEWLAAAIVIIAAFGVYGAYMLTRLLTAPVVSLVQMSRAVGAGELHRRAAPGPPDEIGQLATAYNDMVEQLAVAKHTREELLGRIITAQEEERSRVARELHDETSQAISSLLVGLRNLEAAPPEAASLRKRTSELRQLAAQTLSNIHNLVMELRPRSLDDLGLVAALRRYAADFSGKHGIPVDLHVHGDPRRLPPAIETCLYRVVQEALTNVTRHACARSVSVILQWRADQVSAIVEDDGVGFDPAAALNGQERMALGLRGMQERTQLVGGTVQVESRPGAGTSVYARVPLHEEVESDGTRRHSAVAG